LQEVMLPIEKLL